MNENAQTQIVIPGYGPGNAYVSKNGIVWILLGLSFLALVLLGLLVYNWPDSEPRTTVDPAATKGATTPSPSVTPRPSTTPTPSVTPTPSTTPAPSATPPPSPSTPSNPDGSAQTNPEPGLRVTDVEPSSGGTDGGTLVLISGSDFVDPVKVKFGEDAATDVLIANKA